VKEFASIEPRLVYLQATEGETATGTVTIIPKTPEPFVIEEIDTLKGTQIRYDLKEIEVSGKKAYELSVSSEKEHPGRFYDRISLKTDVEGQAPISIIVSGNIRKQ
jgi:hypothetical protein